MVSPTVTGTNFNILKSTTTSVIGVERLHDVPASGWSLALIGNASAQGVLWKTRDYARGVFDKETRRKPLAFAADALSYGI
jgi:hypothetical protein